ncbi:MAG TPA: TrmH family RNA methyltransferase [Elusimicrobiota bacterium]|jgi:tRNA/rRNA methyltransferase|nr:TrmH family RNA methyltransferase [Elusimicrobiota bacterium]
MTASARVVLVRVRNSLNIGAAARAMSCFGLRDLAAVEPYEPRWREAASAVHGAALLRRAKLLPMEKALAGRHLVLGTASGHNRRARQPVIPLPALGEYLAQNLPRGGKLAILFGSEKTGLRNQDLQHCRALLRIPTRPGPASSMNLGQAVALVAYELARAGLPRAVAENEELPPVPQQLENLLGAALGAMRRADYNQHMPEATRRELLRRMLNRWKLTRGDAAFLQGLLRRLA